MDSGRRIGGSPSPVNLPELPSRAKNRQIEWSLIYLFTNYESAWTTQGCDLPTRELEVIGLLKLMPAVIWSRDWRHLIDILPKGMKSNVDYDISHIHALPEQMFTALWDPGDWKLVVRADNARHCTGKRSQDWYNQNFMKRTPIHLSRLIWPF